MHKMHIMIILDNAHHEVLIKVCQAATNVKRNDDLSLKRKLDVFNLRKIGHACSIELMTGQNVMQSHLGSCLTPICIITLLCNLS